MDLLANVPGCFEVPGLAASKKLACLKKARVGTESNGGKEVVLPRSKKRPEIRVQLFCDEPTLDCEAQRTFGRGFLMCDRRMNIIACLFSTFQALSGTFQ